MINHSSYYNNNQPVRQEVSERELMYEIDVNLTRYMIGLNIVSLFSNIISSIIFIYFILVGLDVVFSYLAIFYDILLILKHGSLFFFLILFNKNFRNYLLKFFTE